MKTSLACPKCKHRRIWVLAAAGDGELMAIDDPRERGFEVYACASCGYAERYAVDSERFERCGGKLVSDELAPGPYR